MERPCVIIGIHGLANKPPVGEKTRWWNAAIAEGLARNSDLVDTGFVLDFVYWADLRYDAPLAADAIVEPHLPHDGRGALPSGKDAPTISGKDVLATVYEGIDRIEEATGITLVDDLILEHRFDDLWHTMSNRTGTGASWFRHDRGRHPNSRLRGRAHVHYDLNAFGKP